MEEREGHLPGETEVGKLSPGSPPSPHSSSRGVPSCTSASPGTLPPTLPVQPALQTPPHPRRPQSTRSHPPAPRKRPAHTLLPKNRPHTGPGAPPAPEPRRYRTPHSRSQPSHRPPTPHTPTPSHRTPHRGPTGCSPPAPPGLTDPAAPGPVPPTLTRRPRPPPAAPGNAAPRRRPASSRRQTKWRPAPLPAPAPPGTGCGRGTAGRRRHAGEVGKGEELRKALRPPSWEGQPPPAAGAPGSAGVQRSDGSAAPRGR